MRNEFQGARFGDARLSARLVVLAEALAGAPDRSLPQAIGGRSRLEAAYRFLSNAAVKLRRILEPHRAQTVERIAARSVARVLHDTTACEFAGQREGLGPLGGAKHQGLLLHCSLAVSADMRKQPLGVLCARTWARDPAKSHRKGKHLSGPQYARIQGKESDRWLQQIREAEETVGDRATLIHIADREADMFGSLVALEHLRFVIRASRDRHLLVEDDDDLTALSDACWSAPAIVELDVSLSPRPAPKGPKAANKARQTRTARLEIASTRVELKKPRYAPAPGSISVNVVHVREINAPENIESVQWVLYTSESVDTVDDVLSVVEHYRARWLIEEFFKALKTGCEFEKLQLETFDALSNALGVYLPIAWSILLLRAVARSSPNAPATDVLTPTQLQVLRRFSSRKMPPEPSVQDAMLAVAVLGGYVSYARPPGWLVLARGMQDLLRYDAVWRAAKADGDALEQ